MTGLVQGDALEMDNPLTCINRNGDPGQAPDLHEWQNWSRQGIQFKMIAAPCTITNCVVTSVC